MADYNPYGDPESFDTGITDKKRAIAEGTQKLMGNVRESPLLADAYKKIINKRAPVRKQIARAANTFSSPESKAYVEDPFARRQLIRAARGAIINRRSNLASQATDALTAAAQAEQVGLNAAQNDLSQMINERDQARDFASKIYLDKLAAARSGSGRKPGAFSVINFGGKQYLQQDGQIISEADVPQEVGALPSFDQYVTGVENEAGQSIADRQSILEDYQKKLREYNASKGGNMFYTDPFSSGTDTSFGNLFKVIPG